MGFHLWVDGDLAWAQGSYEYRPLGAAVVSATDLFHRRDFSARRKAPSVGGPGYLGQFASIGHLNYRLRAISSPGRRQRPPSAYSPPGRKIPKP